MTRSPAVIVHLVLAYLVAAVAIVACLVMR